MKRWGLVVVVVVLGASGIFQAPALAQSSPASSQVIVQNSINNIGTVDDSSAPGTWPTPLDGLDFRYNSASGWSFPGTVWTEVQQTSAAGARPEVTSNSSDTSSVGDRPSRMDPGDPGSTQAFVGVDAASTTIGPVDAALAPLGTPLQAQFPAVAAPLQAQASSPVAAPLQAQASPTAAPPQAQSYTNTLQFVYWPAAVTASVQQGNGTWNTGFYGLDYRLESTQSHWGLHLDAVTGSEGSWALSGTSLGSLPLSGNDTIWTADVTYHWYLVDSATQTQYIVGIFAGYEGRSENFSTSAFGVSGSSSGARIGLEGVFPFASGWALNLSVAYEPSDAWTGSVFSGLGTGGNASASVTGTGWDYLASVQYTTASQWIFSVGYWWSQDSLGALSVGGVGVCPCSVTWSGPFLTIGKQF